MTMPSGLGLILALVASTCALAPEVAGGTGQKPLEGLKIEVTVAESKPSYFVGDTLTVQVAFVNVSDHALVVRDWTRRDPDEAGKQDLLKPKLMMKGKEYFRTGGYGGTVGGPAVASEFITLDPGKRLAVGSGSFLLLLPGQAEVAAGYSNESKGPDRISTQGGISGYETVPMPNVWVGSVSGSVEISISHEVSPAMKARYDAAAETLADARLDVKTRLAALDKVAAEKNLFAARFVRKVWQEAQDPALKVAALDRLLGLLEFGTAYEALPDALKLLKDDTTPSEARKRILDMTATWRLGGGLVGLTIGENLAGYRMPPELVKETMDVLKSLSTGRDPDLAAKAREILKKSEEREKTGKEALKPPAK
jgi:hypothetical protein